MVIFYDKSSVDYVTATVFMIIFSAFPDKDDHDESLLHVTVNMRVSYALRVTAILITREVNANFVAFNYRVYGRFQWKCTQHVLAYNKQIKVLSIIFSVVYYVRQRDLSRHI